ncbi:MAG: HAMP domain-containing sensor histidine kinase [Pseudomonadota bacterium]|nr:HAMP domain-containing sensor histidine kinase [Pseudomonadota bacterium]
MDYPQIRRIDGRFSDAALERDYIEESWSGIRLQAGITLLAFSIGWLVSSSIDLAYLQGTVHFLPTISARLIAGTFGVTLGAWLLIARPANSQGWPGRLIHVWTIVSTIAAGLVACAYPAVETTPDGISDVLVFTSFWMSLHIIVLGVALSNFPWAVMIAATGYGAAYLALAVMWRNAAEHPMIGQSVMALFCCAFGWVMAIMLSMRARRRFYVMRRYEEAKKAAERAHKFTTFLLAATGHDIRQPVFALDLNAARLTELIERGDKDAALDVARQQQTVTRNVSRMISSILEVAHLDSAKRDVSPDHLPVSELTGALKSAFGEIARLKGVSLRTVTSSAQIHADPGIVEHILANLVSNAISHSGGQAVCIGARRRGDGVALIVADNGKGLPAGDIEISERSGLATGEEGVAGKRSGLGLEIMFRLAAHGGLRLHLHSRAGHGVTATLFCPAAPASPRPRV